MSINGGEPECSRCHGSKLSTQGDRYVCPLCGLSTQVRLTAAEAFAGSTEPEPQVGCRNKAWTRLWSLKERHRRARLRARAFQALMNPGQHGF